MEWLEKVVEFIGHRWGVIAFAITWLGIGLVWWRKRSSWLRKEFLTQVNFSLNYVANNTLTMRTLLETTAEKVVLNEWGVKLLAGAAAKTTEDDPFIRLKDARDRDFINRAVLNVVSERFADTFVAAALGVPVKTGKFLFAVTCEKFKDIRTLKIRVLLIEEATFERFAPGGDAELLLLADAKFKDRIKALQNMYLESKAVEHVVGHLELGVIP